MRSRTAVAMALGGNGDAPATVYSASPSTPLTYDRRLRLTTRFPRVSDSAALLCDTAPFRPQQERARRGAALVQTLVERRCGGQISATA